MPRFSQNNKIAVSALAVFLASFSLMLFILGGKGGEFSHGGTNVLQSDRAHEESAVEIDPLNLEATYRVYLSNFNDPIFVTSPEGRIRFASEGFEDILATPSSKLVGKKLFDYVNSEDLSDMVEVYTRTIQNGNKVEGIGPIRMIRKNKERLLLLSAKPVINSEEKVSGIIFAVKDLTEQLKLLDGGEIEEDAVNGGIDDDESWMYRLYPKIEEMEESDAKLIVDKITYAISPLE
jgi:PAS domain S-box-containing protein